MFPPSETKRRRAPQFGIEPPAHVARAEHEVGAGLGRRDQARHVLRVVREVAVHLEHELGAVVERAPEAREVRGPESLLGRAVQHADPRHARAASPSASAPVPSGEPSSITSTRSPSRSTSPSARDHRARGSRARCRWAGRSWRASGAASLAETPAYHRPGEPDAAEERRAGRAVRPARRPDGDPGRATPSASAPTARRRRGSARRRAPSRSSRSTGARRSCRGSARRSRRRSSRRSRTARSHALTKRKAEVPPEVATFIRLPGLGPKTARRLWQELGITTVADAARRGRGARAAQGERDRAEARGADPGRAREAEGGRGAAPRAARERAAEAARRSRPTSRRTRRRCRSRSPARRGASARRCATST